MTGALWLEVDDRGRILRRSEEVEALLVSFEPPVADFARLFDRRTDLRAAVGRRAGVVRFGLGRGAERVTFDAEIDAGVNGARLRLTLVTPLEDGELGRLLAAHVERHPDAYAVSDPDGIILWCDASFAWLVGYDRAEIVGRHSRLYRSPKVQRQDVEAYWRSLYATGSYSGTTTLRRSDGVDVPVHHAVSAVRDPHGRTTHYVNVLHDSSREREIERIRSIDVAVDLLSRVCGDQAHQLNNVAAEMVAVCDQALLSDDPASAGQAIDRVLTLAASLGNLGRQMLALSTAGNTSGPADMGRVARDLAVTLRRAGGDGGPAVQVDAPDWGPWVQCAPDGLVRACIHLALRSLEGVAPGSPVSIAAIEDYEEGLLRIRYTPTAGERATLRWLLPDGAVTGPMVNEFLGRAYGAGVSLQFEEERDGRISICVRAPLSEVVPTSPVATRVVEDGRWNRLVIADDNVPLRELMAVSLEGLFDEIHQVSDGLEVIERIAVCDGKVDLVLVDLRMPNRNGLEVLADLRARWPDVRCIVATGAAPDGFTQSALTAGARAVLAKPFRLHELRAVVRSVMAGAHW